MRSLYVPLLILLLAGLAACTSDAPDQGTSAANKTIIPFDKEGRLAFIQDRDTVVTIDIEIAESDSAKERGMMQREGFPSDTSGMLFPFDE
jgi:hypothetical protein